MCLTKGNELYFIYRCYIVKHDENYQKEYHRKPEYENSLISFLKTEKGIDNQGKEMSNVP